MEFEIKKVVNITTKLIIYKIYVAHFENTS